MKVHIDWVISHKWKMGEKECGLCQIQQQTIKYFKTFKRENQTIPKINRIK